MALTNSDSWNNNNDDPPNFNDDDDGDDGDRCKRIKDNVCLPKCSNFLLEAPSNRSGSSDYGNRFRRCVNQCMYDAGDPPP